jgi:hypothetical protein
MRFVADRNVVMRRMAVLAVLFGSDGVKEADTERISVAH